MGDIHLTSITFVDCSHGYFSRTFYILFLKVTPKAIRLRKKYLDVNKRKAMSKRPKE